MDVDGYIRVSRVKGREGPSFISPAVQRERAEAFARAGGHTVVEWFEDLDQPGSRIDRPGLQAILARIESGKTEGIVVARLDRFARSAADAATLVRRITDAGGALLSAQESIDTAGSFGRFVVAIMAAIGELELERISDNWRTAKEKAVGRGVHIAPRVPFGYEKGKDGILVPNANAEIVREIFLKRSGGSSWRAISDHLLAQHSDAPAGRAWTITSLKHLVGNRVYLGEATAGAGIVNAEAHEPIVSASLFLQANSAKGVAPSRSGNSSGFLSGTLRCGACSYSMVARSGRTSSGKLYREYSCPKKSAAGRCPRPTSAKAERLEQYVLEQFLELVGEARITADKSTDAIQKAEKAVAEAERELSAVLDARLSEALGSNSDALLKAIEERKAVLDSAVAKVEALRLSHPIALPDGQGFEEFWNQADLDVRKRLISGAWEAIFIRPPVASRKSLDGRLYFVERGTALDLPSRGARNVAIRPFDPPDGVWKP